MERLLEYKLEVFDKEGYVYIKFLGDWFKGHGDQILGEILELVLASQHKRAIVDYSESGHMDSDKTMDYAEAKKASTLPDVHKCKFACLFRPEEIDRFLFWETAALNRGIRMKVFEVEQDALAWLIQ
jgi:hypothetical protein